MSDNRGSLDSGCRPSRCIITVALPALILLLLTLTILPSPTCAHPPTEMKLEYHFDELTLSVTLTHSVSTPESHYVKRIEIKKNADLFFLMLNPKPPKNSLFCPSY